MLLQFIFLCFISFFYLLFLNFSVLCIFFVFLCSSNSISGHQVFLSLILNKQTNVWPGGIAFGVLYTWTTGMRASSTGLDLKDSLKTNLLALACTFDLRFSSPNNVHQKIVTMALHHQKHFLVATFHFKNSLIRSELITTRLHRHF